MDLTTLEIELGDLALPEEAYSSEGLYKSLANLVGEDKWDELSRRVPQETAANLKLIADQRGKEKCIDILRTLATKEAARAAETIRQTIRSATSFHVRGSLGDALVQLHERAEEQELRSNLLAIAFADRLTDLVFPAADRAAKLTNLIVRQQPSREAENYLEEACFCYFYALYSACAVMCRAVLEEILRKRIHNLNRNQSGDITDATNTLGALVSKAKTLKAIPPEAFHETDRVKELGDRAAHGDPLHEEDAWESLLAARHAVTCILKARN